MAGGYTPEYDQRWERAWAAGVKPKAGFDAGEASPALLDLLAARPGLAAGARALVPGCGRGYDLKVLADAGAAEAVGLEISGTGAAAARAWLAGAGAPPPRAVVEEADFFEYSGGEFTLGYDYTFMCALHPDQRAAWAAAWARHIAPGGHLVTLIFPANDWVRPAGSAPPPAALGSKPGEGPPWPVTPEAYRELLAPHFAEESVEAVPPARSHSDRAGHEFMGVWRRL